jgi:hypothetical protein
MKAAALATPSPLHKGATGQRLNRPLTMSLNAIVTAAGGQMAGLVKDRSKMASAAPDLEPSRSGPRKRVLVKGTLFTPEGAFTVWIRDVSTSDALISCKERLPVGCDVVLKRGDVFAAAHVTWADDSGANVQFYRQLTSHEIIAATLPLPYQN